MRMNDSGREVCASVKSEWWIDGCMEGCIGGKE